MAAVSTKRCAGCKVAVTTAVGVAVLKTARLLARCAKTTLIAALIATIVTTKATLALLCTALLKAALVAACVVALWASAPAAFAGVLGTVTEATATAKTTTFVAVVKTAWARAIAALATVTTSVITAITKARAGTKAGAAWALAGGGLQARNHLSLDRLLGKKFNIADLAAVTKLSNCHRSTAAARAACAANAVGVVFGLHRQAVVKHVADRWHVNTACGYVGSYQKLNATFAQHVQAAVTHALA